MFFDVSMVLMFLLDFVACYYYLSYFDDDECYYSSLNNDVKHLIQVSMDVTTCHVSQSCVSKHRFVQLLLLLLASLLSRRVVLYSLYLIDFDNADNVADI